MTAFLFEASTRMRGERDHAMMARLGANFLSEDYLAGATLMLSMARYIPVLVDATPGNVKGEVYGLPYRSLIELRVRLQQSGMTMEYRVLESGRFAYVVLEPMIDMGGDIVIGSHWRLWEHRDQWLRDVTEG